MSHVVARIKVKDPLKWWERFRGVGATLRESHGISGGEVFRGEEANAMVVLFECDDPAKVQAFLDDPAVQQNTWAGGVIDAEIGFYEKLGDFR